MSYYDRKDRLFMLKYQLKWIINQNICGISDPTNGAISYWGFDD